MLKQFTLSLLFLTLPITIALACSYSQQNYVITNYGAIADSVTVNTFAIQSAIDKCSKEGGGDVVVPKGTFLTGAIFLKQGVNLHIEQGGVLKGTVKQDDYPQVKTRWEGVNCLWTSALINVVGLTGTKLYGEGTIDGSGEQWTQLYRRKPQSNTAQKRIQRFGRPRLICIQECTGITISGLHLKNHACWCLHILYSEKVIAENIVIRAEHNIPSSDGIDIDSGNDIQIRGCDIDVNDDCISIKSGKDEDGLLVNKPSENILIEKCRFGYGHGGVAMGSETSGGIRNVIIRDCKIEADNWAPIRFKTQPSRGGIVENITYQDIQLNGTRKAFEFNMSWRMVPPIAPPAKVLPVFRNINLINVSGTVNSVGDIHGLKDSPIENIKFENCKISAQKGLTVDNIKNCKFTGLTIEVKEGQSIIQKTTNP
jgi:polygalacturonase